MNLKIHYTINLKRCKIYKQSWKEYQQKMQFLNKILKSKSVLKIKMQKKLDK